MSPNRPPFIVPLSKGGTGARRAPQGALQPSAREPLPAEPHASLPFPSGSLVVLFSWLTKFDLGILIRSALVSALRAGVKNKGTFLLESGYAPYKKPPFIANREKSWEISEDIPQFIRVVIS